MLRDYQAKAVEDIYDAWTRVDYVLAVLATGCGKTVIFAEVIDRFLREHPDKKVMVLAHREELILQARDKIRKFTRRSVAIEMGEMKAGMWFGELHDDIVVSTVQTQLAGVTPRMEKFKPEDFGLVVVDEAHHAVSRTYVKVLKHYRQNKDCKVLGVTATPDRADEKAMGRVFDEVAADYDVGDAIRDGWLTPIKQQMVTVTGLDFSSIRTTAGDLNGADLAEVMEAERVLYGVADATRAIVGERKTLIFTASVKQAQMLADILNRYTADCARAVDGSMDKQERRATVAAYAEGRFQYLVNCAVFTEGFDVPDVSAVVMAKPTKSRALYAQMLGRGTRPVEHAAVAISAPHTTASERRAILEHSGKAECLVVDFSGNCGRHKLVSSVDILGSCGSHAVEDEVIEIAREKLRKAGECGRAMMTEEAIEEAKRESLRRRAEEAKRRAGLKARATFSMIKVDPFDVFGIQRGRERGWVSKRKLSDKQLEALENFGVSNARMLSYSDGKKLLDECFRRSSAGMPSLKQVKMLRRLGVTYPIRTRAQATRIISEKMAQERGQA